MFCTIISATLHYIWFWQRLRRDRKCFLFMFCKLHDESRGLFLDIFVQIGDRVNKRKWNLVSYHILWARHNKVRMYGKKTLIHKLYGSVLISQVQNSSLCKNTNNSKKNNLNYKGDESYTYLIITHFKLICFIHLF